MCYNKFSENLIGRRSLYTTGAEISNFDSLDASSELDDHCGGITQRCNRLAVC